MASRAPQPGFFNVRAGELPRVVALFIHLLLVIAALIILKSVSSALFLKRLDPESLPYLYMGGAVVVTVVMSLSTRFVDRFPRRALVMGTSLFFAATLGVFWSVLGGTHADLIYPALYLWVEVYATVMSIQFWTFAGDLFTGRQGRRLFGLVGAGGVIGSILGGALVSAFAQMLGSEDLLLVAGGLLLAIPPLVLVATRGGATPARPHKRTRHERYVRDSLAYFRSHRYPWMLAGIVFTTIVATTLIDFQFKVLAADATRTDAGLTRFFGQYNAAGGVVSLLLQLFVAGAVLNRLGVLAAVALTPVALILGTSVLIMSPGLTAMFVLKLLDSALSHSVDLSGKQLLYIPLPERISGTIQAFIEGVVGRVGLGFAGLLLLPLAFLMTTAQLSYVTLGFLGVWLVLALRTRTEYRDALKASLQETGFRPAAGRDVRLDSTTRRELLQALARGDANQALVALEFLDGTGEDIGPYLQRLLRMPSTEVHTRALRYVTETDNRGSLDVILGMLPRMPLEVTAEAVEAIGRLAPKAAAQLIQPFLRQEDPRVRGAAIRAVLADGRWDSYDIMALRRFEEMLEGAVGDPELCRVEAARALADQHLEAYRYYLLHYLRDGTPELQRAAIAAAGETRRVEYLPILAEKTLRRETREAAITAIAGYGETILGPLEEAFDSAVGWKRMRKNVLRIVSEIGTDRAAAFLLSRVKFANSWERYDLLKALNKIRAARLDVPLEEQLILDAIFREAEDYYRNAHYLVQLGYPERRHVLMDALSERLVFATERVSRLLALVFPPDVIFGIYRGVYGRNLRLASNAHELLDNLIDRPTVKRLILPLFDDEPVRRTVAASEGQFAFLSRTPEAVLEEIVGHSARWPRLCALYFAGDQGVEALRPRLEWIRREDSDQEARRTAALALRLLENGNAAGREPGMDTLVEKVLFLKEVELFSDLSGEDLTELAGFLKEVAFPAGETVFEQGEPGDALYVVVSGRLDLYGGGRLIESRGRYASVGELSAVDGGPRTFTVVAGTDVVTLMIGELELAEIMQENAEISRTMLRVLVGRVRRYMQLELKALTGEVPQAAEPAL